MTEEATQKCCDCEFGQRVRMDMNYKYPIQYICKPTGYRVYTRCDDSPSPVWCPRTKRGISILMMIEGSSKNDKI